MVFWVMTVYSLRGGYQHCRGTCCLHRLGIAVVNFVKLCWLCKIWYFYSGVFKNFGHLKCDVALLGKWLVIFWRNVSTWTLNPLNGGDSFLQNDRYHSSSDTVSHRIWHVLKHGSRNTVVHSHEVSLFFKCMGRYSMQSFVLLMFLVFAFWKIDVNKLPAFSLLSAADWAYEGK